MTPTDEKHHNTDNVSHRLPEPEDYDDPEVDKDLNYDPEAREPVAPDGGWAWVVLAASFMSSVIVDGVCFGFGIFYLEFLDYYGENKGKTAWIGSVLNGTYMIMGPVAGALANRFGCRVVAITGSVWAALAFFLSTYSANINTLILTYGVFGGMGFGLMYLPSIVIVGNYFDKRRAFATGVATCGSGIGTFIFAPLCKVLIDTFAWKGAQWIIAAIVLNGIILGLFYRPITAADMNHVRRKWHEKRHRKYGVPLPAETEEAQDVMTKSTQSVSSDVLAHGVDKKISSDKMQIAREDHLMAKQKKMLSAGKNPMNLGDSWHSLSAYASSVENLATLHNTSLPRGLDKTAYSGRGLPDPPNHQCRSRGTGPMVVMVELLNSIKETMDFTMLYNPVFVIYGLSCILCMAGFFVPFIYLPDHAIDLGYDSQKGAFLLSILGITSTIGRVLAGWVSDRPWADCLVINNCALVVGGIATVLCPFCTTYVLLAIYAAVFGLCIAAFVSLRSIILVDLIGLDKLTSAFGIIVLCQGITSFVGAPIAGSLYDATGNYHLSFYVAGVTVALGGVICFPLRRLGKWRDQQLQQQQQPNNSKGKYDCEIEVLV